MTIYENEKSGPGNTSAQASPLDRFFGSYSAFQYDTSKSSAEEFQRLRRSSGWRRGDSEGERAWSDFRQALVKEFNWLFGTDPSDLLPWQNMCRFVGISGKKDTCHDCHTALKSQNFNLIDLVDVRRSGTGVVQVFSTEESLQEYTKKTASYFPYGHPKAGNLLRKLCSKPCENIVQKPWKKTTVKAARPRPLLHPDSSMRDGHTIRKDKDLPTSSKKREFRNTKKGRILAELAACID